MKIVPIHCGLETAHSIPTHGIKHYKYKSHYYSSFVNTNLHFPLDKLEVSFICHRNRLLLNSTCNFVVMYRPYIELLTFYVFVWRAYYSVKWFFNGFGKVNRIWKLFTWYKSNTYKNISQTISKNKHILPALKICWLKLMVIWETTSESCWNIK